MKDLHRLIVVAFFSVTALEPVLADEGKKGEIKDTVGLISEPVLRARLKNLGYSDIKITKPDPLRYRIEAAKGDKHVNMYFHPQSGDMLEVGPDEKPLHSWQMPLEPEKTETEPRRPKLN
jgi:hypothetical protein